MPSQRTTPQAQFSPWPPPQAPTPVRKRGYQALWRVQLRAPAVLEEVEESCFLTLSEALKYV